MSTRIWLVLALCAAQLCATSGRAEDLSSAVKKAVEKNTLNQPGTHPFHLMAEYEPSSERDKDSHRNGEVEIWWQSPTKWRREVRSPEFHQIAIVDGNRQWQKNDGDYFPHWLEQLADAIVRPVPLPMDFVLRRVKSAEIRHLAGNSYIHWEKSYDALDARGRAYGYIALTDATGLLFYTGGLGWGGLYHDFKDFHGRMIARTVAAGYVEVTAKISVLEDLGSTPTDFFDASAPGGDPQLIETVVLDETELRKNLLPGKPIEWPTTSDGPFEGNVGTEVVIDRTGKIREIDSAVAENRAMNAVADEAFHAMQFKPVVRDGVPVQALAHLTEHFKTTRPKGTENFDSARNYFTRGRKVSCLSAGASAPYMLHAEFQAASGNGTVAGGRYEDTWFSATEWKREAWFGASHLIRSQVGDQHYVLSEGADSGLLRLLMKIVEPIPAEDTMTESDWNIRRDMVGELNAIRVSAGPEDKLQALWFDDAGRLIKSRQNSMEIRPLAVKDYDGVHVAREIDVFSNGHLGMRFVVKDIGPADPGAAKKFKLKGHEWQRAFTSEVR